MENNQLTSLPLTAKITANHSDISPILEEGIRGKAFAWSIAFLEKQGRAQFGEKFRIHEADHEIVFRLLVYFLGDRYHADKLGLDLSKGILLTGPVGCGKTTLMNLMRLVPPPERNHIMKTCREVSFEFIQEGYEVIGRYSRMSFNNSRPKTYCFDDLGTEQNLKYYGNECNVMGEILLSRYEMFMHHNMITHITTNLSAGEMDDVYGSRVRSRLREMVNLVAYDRITPDKR
jgi:energy-coupling factor transporter ATP-binding protein EcfA2